MQIEERRYITAEVRTEQPSSRVVSGLAVRYGALSEDLGGWRERITRGAFTACLQDRNHDIRMLFSHDPARILGSTKARTLSIQDSDVGLMFRCSLPDTEDGRTVHSLVARGDLRELSFGFRCGREEWTDEMLEDNDTFDRSRRVKAVPVRHVKEAHLLEISPVAFPAYSGVTHIQHEPLAMAAAASRSLFPSGELPLEIRSRFPSFVTDPDDAELIRRARLLLTRLALDEE